MAFFVLQNCTTPWRANSVSCIKYLATQTTKTAAYSMGKDKPKPFLNSKAHAFKVADSYKVTEKEHKRGRFAIPIGMTLFGVVVYMGFIREYGEADKAKVEFLFKDISDKIPPQAYNKMKHQLEEEEKWRRGNS